MVLTFLRRGEARPVEVSAAREAHHPLEILGQAQVTFGIHFEALLDSAPLRVLHKIQFTTRFP